MNNNLFSLNGKIVVITGGLGQLGEVFVRSVIKHGGKALVFDIVDKDNCKQKSDNTLIDNAAYFKVDITKKTEVENAVEKCINKFGPIDVLINNAGLDSPPDAPEEEVGPFETYPENSFDKVMNVNVKGTLLCCQVIGRRMRKQKKGIILNISSIYGMLSPRQDIYDFRRKDDKEYYKPVAYSVSKSAIFNLTKYLATYWAKDNIRVNTLTLAGVFNDQPKEFIDEYAKHVPLGRMLKAEEIEGPIIFLSTEASSYMTGANLIFDGGWSAW